MSKSKPKHILVLNGPNLNLLGTREPDVYGHETLNDIVNNLTPIAAAKGYAVEHFQSNSEGALIDKIHEAAQIFDGLIFNPGAYSHSSIALRDAITATDMPTIEVHLSNIHAREDFRHKSYISAVALGVICGLGSKGYEYALEGLISHLMQKHQEED